MPAGKSSVLLDVKPWDDETDMAVLEGEVRKITMDGLLWGASKLVPVGYGIKKLQIATVVEDDKVSIDELTEKITELEDFVQVRIKNSLQLLSQTSFYFNFIHRKFFL